MEWLKESVRAACNELFGKDVSVELTRPDEQFGDWASNVALQLAKPLGTSPREVAERLKAKLEAGREGHLAKVEVAGPGFLNFTLSDSALWQSHSLQPAQTLAGQTAVVEYSDPNPLKPLHAGHLYTTLVGDTIAKLLEAAGAKVIRVNYGGDVGLHVGRSMWAIIKQLGGEHPDKLEAVSETGRPAWLGQRYVEGTAAYDENEQAKAEIIETNKQVYQLHATGDKDSPFARIYWITRGWSYDYFKVLYGQLQVVPFDRFIPESEVAELGITTVREQLKKGVYEESDGAVIFRGEDYGLHTRVFINSAGLPTYEAKDVGLLLTKWRDYKYDQSIYITANEQAQYVQVMFKSVEQFNPEPVRRSLHLTHGTVKLKGGVKMSSRKGNVVTALEILEAARQAGQASATDPSEDTILAAVKYAFARSRIGGDIIYDPADSVALEGNSGPYLQYAHARARSILHKTQVPDAKLQAPELQPAERSLVRKISECTEIVDRAVHELMPHHICTYLYELAQVFNRFYEGNRVIGDEREAVRLQLVTSYADTLKTGLQLLNITAPERM